MWAFERSLRGKLREELRPLLACGTVIAVPNSDESTYEKDEADGTSRHILGKSEWVGGGELFSRRKGKRRRCPIYFQHHCIIFGEATAVPIPHYYLIPPPSPPLPFPHFPVGDAPTATLRWRPLNVDIGTPAASTVACIDRLFVHPFYRRRHIARMLVLNCLVDVLDQGPKSNVSFSRVSVFFPEDQRLMSIFSVFNNLGFRQIGVKRPDDPSGFWGSQPGRSFVEMALPMAEVLQVLQAAHEAGESIKPRIPVAA